MHNPLGVISRSSLNTTSIFRISFFTFQVLFLQLLFFPILPYFCGFEK